MTMQGRSHLRSWLPLVCVAALAIFAPVAAAAHGQHAAPPAPAVGAVYTETNDPANNQIVVFDRSPDGTLVQSQVVNTGGLGGQQPQPGCPGACPILDAQGEVQLSQDGHLLFAVNAGSNTISSFRVTHDGLKLAQTTPSGGVFPDSITVHDDLLYVLNADSVNIAGYRVSGSGALTPIAGSSRPLSSGAMPGFARQIGFDNTGKTLSVTLLAPDVIDTFPVSKDGTAGAATANPSSTPLPFAFSFDHHNDLVAAQISSLTGTGDVATYALTGSGNLTSIDTEPSQGHAPCWTAITDNGHYVFVVNSGGGEAPATVSEYRLSHKGKLTFVGLTPDIGEFAKTDEALSNDSHFLYVLAPSVIAGATSHIDEYKVGPKGSLTLIGATPSTLAVGISGIAAR